MSRCLRARTDGLPLSRQQLAGRASRAGGVVRPGCAAALRSRRRRWSMTAPARWEISPCRCGLRQRDGRSQTTGPLSHIRVLDLSRIMAGPWAGQILADLGADVIKVERAGSATTRAAGGRPILKGRDGTETPKSGYYLSVNRGKRSVELDLTSAEGQAAVRALAARKRHRAGELQGRRADALRPGCRRACARLNPRLIYCSITGFGATGPKANEAAYDFMIQAHGRADERHRRARTACRAAGRRRSACRSSTS